MYPSFCEMCVLQMEKKRTIVTGKKNMLQLNAAERRSSWQ